MSEFNGSLISGPVETLVLYDQMNYHSSSVGGHSSPGLGRYSKAKRPAGVWQSQASPVADSGRKAGLLHWEVRSEFSTDGV